VKTYQREKYVKHFKILTFLIHLLHISTESKIFQQTSQTISQSDSDSTENHFLKEIKIFLFLNKSEIVPNTLSTIQVWRLRHPAFMAWFLLFSKTLVPAILTLK
jgi:hypothetical protein